MENYIKIILVIVAAWLVYKHMQGSKASFRGNLAYQVIGDAPENPTPVFDGTMLTAFDAEGIKQYGANDDNFMLMEPVTMEPSPMAVMA